MCCAYDLGGVSLDYSYEKRESHVSIWGNTGLTWDVHNVYMVFSNMART